MKTSPRIAVFAASLLCLLSPQLAVASGEKTVEYPPVKLRGYGTLAGTFTPAEIEGRPASVLKIVCDDEEKAKLVQAKYLSDLQILPGMKPVNIPGQNGEAPAYDVETQGAVMAVRDGSNVIVLTAGCPSRK